MLDSYIIKRIREEQERARNSGQRPLHIERMPPPPPGPPPAPDPEEPKRGSVIIDFRL